MSAFASRPTWAAIALFVAGHGFLCAQTRWGIATPLLPFYGSTLAAYDPVARRAVVLDTTTCSTWSVASSTGVWTQVAFQTVPIGYVSDASMVWDTVRQRAVLFGGFDPNGAPTARTWQLVGSTWQQFLPPGPAARHNAGMCFDAVAGVVRLVGGDGAAFGAAPQPLGDVWTFDGAQWTQMPASAGGPLGPTTMAYDSRRALCVALAANGTFEWVGSGFVAIPTTTTPPPRRSAALVYDAFRERVVLFGGRNPGSSTRGDVYEYDGVDWTQRFPLGPTPRRNSIGMVYDPTLQAVRGFAGMEVQVTLGGLITTGYAYVDELRYEAAAPPVAETYAQGCYFASSLGASGLPWLGDTISLGVTAVGSALPVLMAIGASNQQWAGVPLPLPLGTFGFPNCELVVAPDVVLAATTTGTMASLSLAIPSQPLLLGARLHVQAFEPSLQGTGTGSNGLLLQLGGR